MRKYGKWALTLGLMAATPGLGFAAPWSRKDTDQAAETAQSTSAKPSNQQMADRIATSLRQARLQGYDIGIEYKNGTAILTGRVNDPAQKEKATAILSRVEGVQKVDNQLIVVPKAEAANPSRGPVTQASMAAPDGADRRVQQVSATDNQAMAERIASALTAAQLDGYDIEIRYQDGAAILGGSVGTLSEREAAERVVSQVPGVMSVQNHLRPMREPMPPRGPAGHPGMAQGMHPGMGPGMHPGMHPGMGPQGPIHPAAFQPGMGPQGPMPAGYGPMGPGASPAVYNSPSMPDYAWPSYAQYPNSAAVTYPQQYSASAFPYIGPFYPYPQVPLGWRDATLRWDDGQWNLQFRQRTDKWWWFLSPKNW